VSYYDCLSRLEFFPFDKQLIVAPAVRRFHTRSQRESELKKRVEKDEGKKEVGTIIFLTLVLSDLNPSTGNSKLKILDLLKAIKLLDRSWSDVKSESIINCWRKCGFD